LQSFLVVILFCWGVGRKWEFEVDEAESRVKCCRINIGLLHVGVRVSVLSQNTTQQERRQPSSFFSLESVSAQVLRCQKMEMNSGRRRLVVDACCKAERVRDTTVAIDVDIVSTQTSRA